MKTYRAAVGPPDKFDLIGGLQFRVLYEQGIRERHYLLDVGCGSLRGGRLFLVYLQPGRYYGVEKHRRLVEQGIEKEIGRSILQVKQPTFRYTDQFDIEFEGVKFDYVLAQSIFSHATQAQINKILAQVRKILTPNGKFVFTYFRGNNNYTGNTWAQSPDAHYTEEWMKKTVEKHGLNFHKLSYAHPSFQNWVLAQRSK